MAKATSEAMSVEAYLALEDTPGVRYEWLDGETCTLSDHELMHCAVNTNVMIALHTRAREASCHAFGPGLLVYVESTGTYLSPDAFVASKPLQMRDAHSVMNATVIAEVLSPETAARDRGAKLEHYLRTPSLTDVLFVDPRSRTLTHHARKEGGWLRRDIREGDVTLNALPGAVPVAEFFEKLEHVPDP